MKKALRILLTLVIMLGACGCAKTAENTGTPSDAAGTSAGENAAATQSNHFVPDLELLQERIREIYSVNVIAFSGKCWGDYSGFDSPHEISTDGLLNFFLSGDGSPYYNAAEKQYVYSESDVQAYLSQYFQDVAFHGDSLNYWTVPDKDGVFRSQTFIGFDSILEKIKVDDWKWDSSTQLLIVNGSLLSLEDENSINGHFTAVFHVSEGHYYYVSFHDS